MRTLHVRHGNDDDNLALGLAIREARLAKQISGSQLGRAVGVSRQMISGIEHGRTAPSVATLVRMLQGMGEEYTVTEYDSVVWGDLEIVCSRHSRWVWSGEHLPPPNNRPEAPGYAGSYIQILDWR